MQRIRTPLLNFQTAGLTLGALALMAMTAAPADARWTFGKAPAPDGVLVDLDDSLSEEEVDALMQEAGLPFERAATNVAGNRVEVHGVSLEAVKRRLAGDADVESVESNVIYSLDHHLNGTAHSHGFDDGASLEQCDEEDGDDDSISRPIKPNDPMYKN